MARSTTSSKTTPFGKRLLAAREAAGYRLDDAAVFARVELQSTYGPSRETIRRYEVGEIDEDRADMVIVAALARIYNVPMESLSAVLAAQMRNVVSWATPANTSKRKPAAASPTTRNRKPKPRSTMRWSSTAARGGRAA